jgi:chromosomal replication initiator protein
MQAWQDFITVLEKEYGKETVVKWVLPIKLVKFDAGNVYLEAKDSFQMLWFEEHVKPKAKKYLINNNNRPIKIHIKVDEKNAPQQPQAPQEQKEETVHFVPDRIESLYSFEQFIAGNQNLVPFQVLCKLAGFNPEDYKIEKPALELATYNPIFLYGPSGSGKTHLMMALAQTLSVRGLKVFYVRSETFTQHVVSAIRLGKMQEFRQAYRHVDVLMIDDIQVFSRKNATQEELFHTFNTLHTEGKQIILSANLAPRFLDNIEERLISRFEWGLTLPLEKVSTPKELQQIIQKRTQFYRFPLKQEVIEYLVKKFGNAKTLTKAIEILTIKSHLHKIDTKQLLELDEAKSFLAKFLEEESKEKLTEERLLQIVSENFGIKIEDMTGKSQSRESVVPRQIAMFLLRKELKLPFMRIGSLFSRDHSTVMSSIKNVTKAVEDQDKELSSYLNEIQRKIINLV